MIRQYELVEAVKAYDPHVDEDLLNRAYVFAMKIHGTQARASGDLYFTHPLEVAGILVRMHLDAASIATALLHDTVEDTAVTLDEIESLFGKEIAFLVDGVTKLSQIEFQSDKTKQAENFRKLLLAMSSDIRVLLVKLADRLHNMRTLQFIEPESKRQRIAKETMEIYAPLAERIGLHAVKDELQTLAFSHLHPDAYTSILTRLQFLRDKGTNLLAPIIDELEQTLTENDIKAQIWGREKTPYSIWHKMQKKNIPFEHLSDIMAFRINVETVSDCYRALGAIHSAYSVLPGRFKDYISTPKQNNYQSIHTAVIGPGQHRIEVQIRTKKMDEVAELGVAAHWQYKQGVSHEGHQYRWLRSLLDILEHAEGPEEFLEHTKLEMFQDQVFCFTPKGDLIPLPSGATPIDFAYAVHSSVGDHCTSVRINGRMMPLRTVLENGDQVEIITSKSQTPSPTWERFVVTGKARSCIRRFIRHQMHQQFVDAGKAVVEKTFEQEGLALDEKKIKKNLESLGAKTLQDVYAAIGEGLKSTTDLIRVLYPRHKTATRVRKVTDVPVEKETSDIIGLLPNMPIHLARCCHPIPGDPIVGIVNTGTGVTIHASWCKTLDSFVNTPKRWLDVSWREDSQNHKHYTVRISLVMDPHLGSMAEVTTLIARHNVPVRDVRFTTKTPEFYELYIDLGITNLEQLKTIIASLRMSSYVISVDRQ